MELRHLRYFRAVAETLNFSRAAERLHVAQPALSRQIRDLEEELGTSLFDRNRVSVQLTDAGRLFLTHVEKVLAQVDMAVSAVREVSAGSEGELIVCTDWRLTFDRLPESIAEFRRRFPRVKITLKELQINQHLVALRAHKAHLAFAARPALGTHKNMEFHSVLRTKQMVILPTNHPLGKNGRVRLYDLRSDEWIGMEDEDGGYATYVQQACRLSGFTPQFRKKTKTLEGFFGLVASGLGVAMLPDLLVEKGRGVTVVATDAEDVDICAVWNSADKSPLLRNFVEILVRLQKSAKPAPAPKTWL